MKIHLKLGINGGAIMNIKIINQKRMFTKLMLASFCLALTSLVSPIIATVQASTFNLLTEELPPYAMKKGGKPTGATVEIVSKLFERAGIEYNVRIVPWKRAYLTAEEETNTCIFPVQRSQEREVKFHWVSPIVITQTGFYTRDDFDKNLRTLNDVKALKIGSYKGSAAAEYLHGQGYKTALITRDAPNIQKLQAGRIDVWAADTLTAVNMMKERNVNNVNESLVYFTTLRALACNLKTPIETINKLSKELKKMYSDGSVKGIMDQYK